MDAHDHSILIGAILVLAFWGSYQFMWRRALIDKCRQDLFHVRDRLFGSVAKGHGSFDDPAYGMLRMMLNSAIRSANRLSLSHMVLTLAFHKKLNERRSEDEGSLDIVEKFRACVDRMEEGQAKRLYRAAYRDMTFACARHAIWTWIPLVSIIFFIVLLASPVRQFVRRSPLTRRLGAAYVDGASHHTGVPAEAAAPA